MKGNSEKFNWEGTEFPMQVDKIDIYEKNTSKYGINVYGYKKKRVYPLPITKNEDRKKTINLLMISNSKTDCWIKKYVETIIITI